MPFSALCVHVLPNPPPAKTTSITPGLFTPVRGAHNYSISLRTPTQGQFFGPPSLFPSRHRYPKSSIFLPQTPTDNGPFPVLLGRAEIVAENLALPPLYLSHPSLGRIRQAVCPPPCPLPSFLRWHAKSSSLPPPFSLGVKFSCNCFSSPQIPLVLYSFP